MSKHRKLSNDFKVRVAFDASQEKAILSELSSCFDVHQMQISAWKKQVLLGLLNRPGFTGE